MSRVWQNSEVSFKIDKMSTLREKIAKALEGDRVLRNAEFGLRNLKLETAKTVRHSVNIEARS